MNDVEAWRKLASVSVRQGNLEIAELCYQRTKDLEKLAFLYVVTGNFEKLHKMLKIAEGGGNMMARFQIALFLGDIEARAKVLTECGQIALARIACKTHGLDEMLEELGDDDVKPADGSLMMPPVGLTNELSWPTIPMTRTMFMREPNSDAFEEPSANYYEDAAAFAESEREPTWDDENPQKTAPVDPFAADIKSPGGAEGDAWGDDVEFDIPGDDSVKVAAEAQDDLDEFGNAREESESAVNSEYYVPPPPGAGVDVRWTRNSRLAGELAASGAINEAMTLLKRQIGVASFEPMKGAFMACINGSVGSMSGIINMAEPLVYFSGADSIERPVCPFTMQSVRDKFKSASQCFTAGKFSDALSIFKFIISALPLLVAKTGAEKDEAFEVLEMSREYVTGIMIEMRQKQAKQDGEGARQVQLAGLFTKCRLAPIHIQLTLRAGMKAAYDTQNFVIAAGFARRLLDTSPRPELAASARKMIQFCDKNMTNKSEVDFDDRREFVIDCGDFVPLYSGSEKYKCPYCSAAYSSGYKGRTCPICGISEVGAASDGLKIYL
eukprot:Plantae.Rhodophyta-Rhodochaete_pulchella.ctg2761.p1 GENE.Plantae.Rhodophyta-Rhodochaete_pulchella.ctg2761~~Plantae.Rhodophyta-Rhodochaete_pulchella.ctg2761.p1  ORF type:complete len:553 (+),score=110.24 Plantae.Rhodophyta-Rhodochaete_pulchella.ctg2761:343-2001(+)